MRHANEQGFALIETVIATLIIAAMLGLTYQTIGQAQHFTEAAETRRQAMLIARSILAQAGTAIPLVPGAVRGEEEGMRWQIEIAPQPSDARDHSAPIDRVTVSVLDDRDRTLARLETLRLAHE